MVSLQFHQIYFFIDNTYFIVYFSYYSEISSTCNSFKDEKD
jgi:hypothetical protein